MRVYVRSGLMALTALGVMAVAGTQAQTPPAGKPAAPARPANLQQVLATVNGEPITKADFLDLVIRYNLPSGNEAQVYSDGIETLVNTRLINQFLARQQLPVSDEKINNELEQLKKTLSEDGRSLAQALDESGKTIDDVKKELAIRQRWIDYVNLKATDAALRTYVAANKDLFNGTAVRASHVLLKVDPKATPEDLEKVKQRLLQIKRDVEAGKLTFAEAANKFSEDPNKTEGDGGDIGYFGKNGEIIEEFADTAFALKKGQVSDPVRTVFGYHLIQQTDKKEGQPFDLAAKKQFALTVFSSDLQKQILEAAKKSAKIDIKPMPADLFPPAPASSVVPSPGTTKAAAPKQ